MSASLKQRDLESWAVADVVDFLKDLELEPVAAGFKENAVCGSMLLSLTDEELSKELGMRPLQIKKLKGALDRMKAAHLADDAAATRDVGSAAAAGPVAVAVASSGDAIQPVAVAVAEPAAATAPAKVSEPAVVAAAAAIMSAPASATAAPGPAIRSQPVALGAPAVAAVLVEPVPAPQAASMRAYSQAQFLLRQAEGALAHASDLMGRALGTQAAQTGLVASQPRRRGLNPFGMVVDMRQKQQTRTACELADTAVNAINQARAVAPDLPAIQTPAVKEVSGALVQGLTRSPLMDAFRTGKVAISKQSIDACRQQIGAAQAFLTGRISGMAVAAQAQQQAQQQPQPLPQPQPQLQAQFQQQAPTPAPSAQFYAPPTMVQAGVPMAAPPPSGFGPQASPMAGSSAGSIAGTALVGGMLMGAAARNARVRRGVRIRR